MDKQRRHIAIREIIAKTSVGSQEELSRILHRRGFNVTQATLSRDLKDLGVSRVPKQTGARYALPERPAENDLRPVVAREVLAIRANESTIVINTYPGRAQGVARFIDSQADPEILGTVAGDDTVIVLPRSVKRIKQSLKHVEEHFAQ